MKIACDWDSTLADSNVVITYLMNFKHGTNYAKADIDSWTFWTDRYGDDFWRIFDLFDHTYLRRAIPPTDPLACAVVKWLVKRGHEVEIVTSNHEASIPTIRAWLFGHGLDLPIRSLGRIDAEHKAALEYDLLIDDAPGLAAAMAAQPQRKMILVDQPWNQENHLPPNVWRLKDWALATDRLIAMGF